MNLSRLMNELEQLAQFSDAPAPAVTRVLFTPAELEARAWVRAQMREAELEVWEDGVGNIFGRFPGQSPHLPPVATGSHIDAIPFSGKYDGTVGVLGGLEAIRSLREAGVRPERSIDLIMFTAEEPTRFGLGCLGSRALCGDLSAENLHALTDADGQTLEDVRRAAGYDAPLENVQLAKGHYHRFLELHIEQGARLEAASLPIAAVTAIAAPATLRVRLTGDGGHAGARLMDGRRDALCAASEVVLATERAANGTGRRDSVATVGFVENYPNAVNSIPSKVTLEIDIRDTDLAARDGMVEKIQAAIREACGRRGVGFEVGVLNQDRPITCHPDIIAAVESAASDIGLKSTQLVSRAYHDALFMGQICPSGMLFVPSQNGYSHRPEEYTSPEEIGQGVRVLAGALAGLASS